MKFLSIITIATVALFALCSGAPLAVQNSELEARIEALDFLYDNVLGPLFSGLVSNTFGHLSNTLNNLIQTNPLGLGKREVQDEIQARIDALDFLYDNVLGPLFSGLVSNTFGHLSNTLNNLIQTNPLGLGKREAQDEILARIEALDFLYDNILGPLFSGLVSNTFSHLSNTLNNLIQTNPLGLGKREV
ncbi:unnamed protein product [Rotaria socialis]|uniref:Uncharacterized protein n=2 Tax=Rotaria socialis TaxID=392032 RepID=A0A821Y9G8_9BILA|nr:unnamed protein product [Rotaria socialis]CAF3728411.1 unnamed protein product [Rotaria socialis]CAF4198623.1 unnamed protein product [Rotaria socialis]CAF4950609.1 unnamed protein product [Rotaria socialis]